MVNAPIPPLPLALLNAWAALHGEHWLLWTLHWRAKGANQYGDHLLYQRLYEARSPELDRMAEVIAAVGGADLLNPARAMAAAQPFIAAIDSLDAPDAHKALVAVQTVMLSLREADAAAQGTPYAMGVNNALAGFSDSHLEAVYLLQQRLNGRVTQPAAAPSPYTPYSNMEYVPEPQMMDIGEPDEDAASIFASHRRNSRRNKQSQLPQIVDQFGSLLGFLPGLQTGGVTRSLSVGVIIGGIIYSLLALIKGQTRPGVRP
jgi:DNA-binding ferritin-like protein